MLQEKIIPQLNYNIYQQDTKGNKDYPIDNKDEISLKNYKKFFPTIYNSPNEIITNLRNRLDIPKYKTDNIIKLHKS